jgi:hypothetical protein
MIFRKVLKLSITFILGISPDSTPNSVRKVLRNHHQSESAYVFKVLSLVHCVPMIITLSLFIRIERMSNY